MGKNETSDQDATGSLSPIQEKQSDVSSGKNEKKIRSAPPKLNKSPLHGLWALTHRDLRKWYTNPYQFISSLIQPIVWLALFGKALNFGTILASGGGTPAEQNAILLNFFGMRDVGVHYPIYCCV